MDHLLSPSVRDGVAPVSTGSTLTVSAMPVGVGLVVGVTVRTLHPTCLVGGRTRRAQHVLARGDGSNVRRIAAVGSITGEVVELPTFRDRAYEGLVREPMRVDVSVVAPEVPVTLGRFRSEPQPASPSLRGVLGDRAVLIDLGPESVQGCTHPALHDRRRCAGRLSVSGATIEPEPADGACLLVASFYFLAPAPVYVSQARGTRTAQTTIGTIGVSATL